MLKFRYIFEIEKYIQVAYLEYRDQQQLYFQAQFIKIKTEAIDVMSICSKYKKSVKRNYNQHFYRKNSPNNSKRKRQIYSENFGTPPHDKLKANMRLCNDPVHVRDAVDQVEDTTYQYDNMKSKSKVRKLFHDINMPAPIVLDFKNQIKEGPLYLCVICNHCLYKIAFTLFKKENYDDVNEILTSLVKSYDGLLYICKTCNKALKKKFIPYQAVSNKLDISFLPKEFESRSKHERVLVSRRILFRKW